MSEPIVDTSTPLATPTPERRPAAKWDRTNPSTIVLADLIECHVEDGAWRVCNVYGDDFAEGEAGALEAAQLAAEDAAARLLLAALADLPDARRLMAEALAGRER